MLYHDGDQESYSRNELLELLELGKPHKLNATEIEFAYYRVDAASFGKRAKTETRRSFVPDCHKSDNMSWKLFVLRQNGQCVSAFGFGYRSGWSSEHFP